MESHDPFINSQYTIFNKILAIYIPEKELDYETFKSYNKLNQNLSEFFTEKYIENSIFCQEIDLEKELNEAKTINEVKPIVDEDIIKSKYKKAILPYSRNYRTVEMKGENLEIFMNDLDHLLKFLDKDALISVGGDEDFIFFDILYLISISIVLDKINYDSFSKTLSLQIIKELEDGYPLAAHYPLYYNCDGIMCCEKILSGGLKMLIPCKMLSDINIYENNKGKKILFFVVVTSSDIEVILTPKITDPSHTSDLSNAQGTIITKMYGSNKIFILPNPVLTKESLEFILANFFNLNYKKLANILPNQNLWFSLYSTKKGRFIDINYSENFLMKGYGLFY